MTIDEDHVFGMYRKASKYLKGRLEECNIPFPLVGIICGSGLSGLSSALTCGGDSSSKSSLTVSYSEIPGFPNVTVVGHSGEVVFGMLEGIPTICFRGRFHSYEGHDMNTVVLPVRVMRMLGVKVLLVTNAAGGLNTSYNVGDIVCINDHFALPMLVGNNPLMGPNDEALGPRFPPTSNMYDTTLQQLYETSISSSLEEEEEFKTFCQSNGTYCFVSGPMYESKAECRFLRSIGGDTVGMSTVPELLAAHHCGIKVLCLSLVTNKVVTETTTTTTTTTTTEAEHASHEEVIDAVNKRSKQIQTLVKEIMSQLHQSNYLNTIQLPPIDDTTTTTKTKKIVACPYHIIQQTFTTKMIMMATLLSIGAFLIQKK